MNPTLLHYILSNSSLFYNSDAWAAEMDELANSLPDIPPCDTQDPEIPQQKDFVELANINFELWEFPDAIQNDAADASSASAPANDLFWLSPNEEGLTEHFLCPAAPSVAPADASTVVVGTSAEAEASSAFTSEPISVEVEPDVSETKKRKATTRRTKKNADKNRLLTIRPFKPIRKRKVSLVLNKI